MRKLVHIPIVHTPEDLGSHSAEVEKQYIARYGASKWFDHLKAVGRFWQELAETLLNLSVDYSKIKLYQDSLPVCGSELEIVEQLAQSGNRNYQLLLQMAKKGAMVMGTEDPELLIEERDRLAKNGTGGSYDDLMGRRDDYIAQRIDATLSEAEIGILLIGALHNVATRLPKDIQIYRSISDLKE